MELKRSLVTALLLLASFAAEASCMVLTLQQQGTRLLLQSDADSNKTSPERSAKDISKDFRQIYTALEETQEWDGKFDARLQRLSQELYGPLLPAMRKASCIVFSIEPRFMHFALDLLPIDGSPLFVQKAVAFSLGKPRADTSSLTPKSRGLIVRDLDTDPEDGANEVRKLYPNSILHNAKNVGAKLFVEANYDFLLISAHGFVTPALGSDLADPDDSIRLGKGEINADALAKAKFKLLYLDSCQLGMSKPFIDAASRSGARHYLAPIISNESGHSSTLTIRYFFGDLNKGKTPMEALFHARKRLYQDFQSKASRTDQIFYAYPFRLYIL
ncbi:hypothetical protein R6242_04260 [Iodobacter sp. CM08]|uniref:hypothetical protein n=1 Tax=Iodobacter sp. CM08 TaxID=3085902 RepID=UPI0029821CA7|nr:hypothetical protein [Iodobacter sp. CM08]MDW5415784.1 hypothetical protein [Iodobacter sp. CM08]